MYDDYGFRRFFLFGSRFSPPETGQKEEPCPGESVPVKQPFLCVGLHSHTCTGNHMGKGWPISVVQESTPGHAEGMGKAGNGRRLFTDDHGLAVLVNDGFSVAVYGQFALAVCKVLVDSRLQFFRAAEFQRSAARVLFHVRSLPRGPRPAGRQCRRYRRRRCQRHTSGGRQRGSFREAL